MSKRRHTQLPPIKRDATGRQLCRWCAGPVKRPRRSWCSDKCVAEYKVQADPEYARNRLWKRDHGVCQLCGLDCERLVKSRERHRYRMSRDMGNRRHAWDRRYERWTGRSIPGHRISYWDADHILPVSEGGGECGLDNLRTLCVWCHRRETGKLLTRLAAK